MKPSPAHATPATNHGNAPDTAEIPPRSPVLDWAGQQREEGELGQKKGGGGGDRKTGTRATHGGCLQGTRPDG